MLHPDHQGHGNAAEAIVELAFGTYRLHRVYGCVEPRNTASARVLEGSACARRRTWSRTSGCPPISGELLRTDAARLDTRGVLRANRSRLPLPPWPWHSARTVAPIVLAAGLDVSTRWAIAAAWAAT
jgi:hypothetical protein